MSLSIPITIANVASITYGETAYLDPIKTFVFVGEPTEPEREEVLQYAFELVQECTDQLNDEDISEALFNATFGDNKFVEFNDGAVYVRWETQL